MKQNDDLNAARGVAWGLVFSLILWVGVFIGAGLVLR